MYFCETFENQLDLLDYRELNTLADFCEALRLFVFISQKALVGQNTQSAIYSTKLITDSILKLNNL